MGLPLFSMKPRVRSSRYPWRRTLATRSSISFADARRV